jgi:TonB family protein
MKRMFNGWSLTAMLCLGVAGPAFGQGGAIRAAKIEAPIRVSAPFTSYPDELRRQQISGTVIVEAKIDTTGQVDPTSIKIVHSPDARFDEAAKDFVARSRYRAGRTDGKRVAMYVHVPVSFDLNRW